MPRPELCRDFTIKAMLKHANNPLSLPEHVFPDPPNENL
jgi:hypothetical protein